MGVGRWGPGQTGNPGGRPKMPPEEREAWGRLARMTREMLERRLEAEEVSLSTLIEATKVANNRAYGVPAQAIELSGPDGGPVELSHLSDEELDSRLVELRARDEL